MAVAYVGVLVRLQGKWHFSVAPKSLSLVPDTKPFVYQDREKVTFIAPESDNYGASVEMMRDMMVAELKKVLLADIDHIHATLDELDKEDFV